MFNLIKSRARHGVGTSRTLLAILVGAAALVGCQIGYDTSREEYQALKAANTLAEGALRDAKKREESAAERRRRRLAGEAGGGESNGGGNSGD